MPRGTKQKKDAVVSNEAKRETKKGGDDLQSALFKYNELAEFLEKSSDLINDAIADWCIKIVGDGERKLDAYPEPETYLYWLVDAGAIVFSTYRKEISKNPELLKITQQLAALCFPYTPSLNTNVYFILEKNYLTPHNQTGHLSSYFFFLRNLLIEKNIDFAIRLTCLSGALQFYMVYRNYLTNAFIERMFTLLNSSEAKMFFLEYKQIFEGQMNDLRVYIPHYQFLTRQSREFWKETVTSPDIEAWIHSLRKEITRAVNADNAFIKEKKLTTHFSLFNKELEEFIQLLLLNKDDVNSKELKEEIFLPTRAVREQIASFTDRDHPLREFFSAKLLDALRKKNKLKPQQLSKECEDEETVKIEREAEKTQAIQRAAAKAKIQAEQLELESKNEREAKESEGKKEKEFRGLLTLLNEFSASLQRSIKFINELLNSENKNKARQQFKAEFGKLNSKLKTIYDFISLETKNFIIGNISNALVEIENKVKNHENFNESKINFLRQEITEIKNILEKAKHDVSDIIQELNISHTEINNLSVEHANRLSDLIQKGEMNKKMRRELGKLISEKEKLISKFHQSELVLREYTQIVPLSAEQTTQLTDLFSNIDALEKLSKQLDKEYAHIFTSKETPKTRPKVEATQSSPSRTSTIFVKTPEKDAKNQRSKVFPASLLPEKYGESIADLKDNFFTTLAVVHLVSKITFNQGRGKLAYIYIQKLNVYKERLKEASISLSEHAINLGPTDDYIKSRRQEEKEELERLDKCIDNLICIVKTYGEGEKEFYQVDSKKDEFNRLLYFLKKELVPETIRVELMQKGFLSEEEVNQEDCFSQTQKLETRLRGNKLLLDNAFFSNSEDIRAIREKNVELQELLEKKYSELGRINNNLRKSYIAGQHLNYETIHRSVLPLISGIPTATVVPVISIAQPFNFFQLPVVPVVNAAMISGVTRTVNNPRSSN